MSGRERLVPPLSRRRLLVLSGAVAFVAACGGGNEKESTTKAAPQAPGSAATQAAAAKQPTPAFDALVAKAKAASNKQITGAFEADDPAFLRELEAAWEKKFGFTMKIGVVPGHADRDPPPQVLAAGKANKASHDYMLSGPQALQPLLAAGELMKLDWPALEEGFPLVKSLHAQVPAAIKDEKNGALADHALVGAHSVWGWVMNTTKVKPNEADKLTFEDLTKPQWKNRVVLDNQMLAVYVFPLAPGWNENRMVEWVKAMKANGAKAVAGGSSGVIQSLLQGEGDITIASPTTAFEEKTKGAPIDYVPSADPWIPGLIRCAAVPRLTLGDPAVAQLFMAWRSTDGVEIEQKRNKSGLRISKEENNVLIEVLKKYNKSFDNLVYAANDEQAKNSARWRTLAIDTWGK